MGKYKPAAMLLEEGVQQVGKHLLGNKGAQESVQQAALSLDKIITSADNLKFMDQRSKAHPGAFTPDRNGIIQSGNFQKYYDSLPENWKHNFQKYNNELPGPDEQADFHDLLLRAAADEAPAKGAVTQAARTLEAERLAQSQQTRLQNVGQAYQTQQLIEGDKARKGNQQLLNEGRSKEEVSQFYQAKGAQEAIGSHHHIDDLKFIGDATNRADRNEILKNIEELRPGTEFGDRKAGLIGAFDQKTTGFRASARDDIAQQIPGFDRLPKAKQKRLLNDLQKEAKDTGDDLLAAGEGLYKVNKQYDLKTSPTKEPSLVKRKQADFADPTDPESYGLPRGEPTYRGKGSKAKQKGWKVADKWPDGRPVTIDDRRSAYLNRLDRLNIDRQKVKYDPSQTILPKDHIEIIHYAGYNSPKFKAKREVEALIASGEWLKKTPREAAEMIVKVMDTHRMIVLNVSLERLRMIKDIIKKTEDKPIAEVILTEPQNIRRWVEENLQTAANVGWKKKIPTFEELTTPPKLEPGELEEVNAVFATELASIPEKILSEVQ